MALRPCHQRGEADTSLQAREERLSRFRILCLSQTCPSHLTQLFRDEPLRAQGPLTITPTSLHTGHRAMAPRRCTWGRGQEWAQGVGGPGGPPWACQTSSRAVCFVCFADQVPPKGEVLWCLPVAGWPRAVSSKTLSRPRQTSAIKSRGEQRQCVKDPGREWYITFYGKACSGNKALYSPTAASPSGAQRVPRACGPRAAH